MSHERSGGNDTMRGRPILMNIAAPLMTVLRLCGVDRATAYTALRQVTSLLTGVGSLYFIIHYLSGAEQGFYYTFGSILGFTVFLELGLESVLVQFASHERAHLTWTRSGTLEGESKSKS